MKKLLSLFLAALTFAASLAVLPASAAPAFSDVESDRWSAAAIKYVSSSGYMIGTGDGFFSPDGELTRAEAVTVIWRRHGSPEPSAPIPFSDVEEGAWYADAVAWAAENGFVYGVSDFAFAPADRVTREQLAAMLFRYSATCPVSVPDRSDLSVFSDADEACAWAVEPLSWAVEAGVIEGVGADRLDPEGGATREQLAAVIQRFDETFTLSYSRPVVISKYTEKEYPLVTDADFYVSVDGDDAADGSFERPFATWGKAAEAVRELKQTKPDDITVAFMAGDYGPLSVSLTEEDSGSPTQRITYCKYGDGDVTFSGGLDITPDDFETLTDEEKSLFNPKRVANIKKYDLTSIYEKGLDKDSIVVFSDDWICSMARYPNKYDDGSDNLQPAAESYSDTALKIISTLFARKIAGYSDETVAAMRIYGYIDRGYRKDTFKVASFDYDTGVLEIANPEHSEFGKMRSGWRGSDGQGIRICILDIPYELDFADEYWIDESAKTLYVYDPSGTYHIPAGDLMVSMDNANDITFRGLTFKNSQGGFIHGTFCHGITVDLCEFCATSDNCGVLFDDCLRDRDLDITATDNVFSCAFGQSFRVCGRCSGELRYSKRANVLFDNNLVRSSNLVYDVDNAVDLAGCSELTVTHNSFVHSSRGAVSFSGSYNVLVEYNDFDSVMINSEDGGAVYSNGNVDGRHITVRHNLFNYMPKEGTGTFGYYIDDNTAGVDMYENLFFESGTPAVIHKGRDNYIHDNIAVSNSSHIGFGFSISQRATLDELGPEGAQSDWDVRQTTRSYTNVFNNIELYPEYRAGVERWCPEILNYHLDYDNMDDPNFVMNPVNTVVRNVYINEDAEQDEIKADDPHPMTKYFLRYSTVGEGRAFFTSENPCFVNPTAGDYRIRAGVDFPDIEFELIGRY